MRDEFDALEQVSGNFATFVDREGLHPNTLLSELREPHSYFLRKVTVGELKLVIELAERYAGLCDE